MSTGPVVDRSLSDLKRRDGLCYEAARIGSTGQRERADDRFNRRIVLTTGAAVAATTAAPQVFAQAPQGVPAGAKVGFYEKGNVRIRYAEIGSGFPLLATPGGGLNSRIARLVERGDQHPGGVQERLPRDHHGPAQRHAAASSTGPVPVDDPWGAFADDQLGVMDHLGIDQFFFFGNCIGGPFAMKLMERAPQRVTAAVLSQPVGHRPENPDVHVQRGLRRLGQGIPRAPARRVDGDDREVPAQPLPRAARLRVQRVARISRNRARRRCWCCPTTSWRIRCMTVDRHRVALPERRDHGVSLEGAAGAEGAHHQPRADVFEGKAVGIGVARRTIQDGEQ